MTRYHPLIVALHWLLALMILMALVIGGPMLADIDNSDPAKLGALGGHMIWGLTVGTLMIVRLITRARARNPAPADAGSDLLNRMARLAHIGLYVLVLTMVASGLGTALSAGLFDIVYGGSGDPLPQSFHIYTPRQIHGLVANLLLALIVLHIAAWGYHQFYRKDGLIRRMWFGKRSG